MVESPMLWWPVITILATLPAFVWEDWRYRELKDSSMALLLIVNIPFLAWAYSFGGFGWEEIVVSVLPICIYYAMTLFTNDYFHGDDFIYMAIVSLCLVVNPIHPFSGAIPVKILIYMAGVAFSALMINFVRNAVISHKNGTLTYESNVAELANRFEGGFPMMFIFAPTIILALIL